MPQPATLLNRRLWHRCFLVNFAKFLRTPFLQNTSGLVYQESFQDELQSPFSLILMHQQLLELLMSVTTFFLPGILYFDSFSNSLAEIFISIRNVKSVSFACFFYVIFYNHVWFVCLYCSVCINRKDPIKLFYFLFLQLSVAYVRTSS